MPLTYDQVLQTHEAYRRTSPRFAQMSLDDFVKGDPEMEAAVSGRWIKEPVRMLREDINATGIPGVAGDIFSTIAGQFDAPGSTRYRDLYRGVGQSVVQSLPEIGLMMAGGPVGIGAGAALAGAKTYEETDSPAQAFLSAGSMALLPKVADIGAKAAVKTGTSLFPSQAGKLATDTMANRLTNVGGSTVAATGWNIANEFLNQNVVGDREGFGTAADGTPLSFNEYLALQGVSQIPFSALDVPRLFPKYRGNYRPIDQIMTAAEQADAQTVNVLGGAWEEAKIRAQTEQTNRAFAAWAKDPATGAILNPWATGGKIIPAKAIDPKKATAPLPAVPVVKTPKKTTIKENKNLVLAHIEAQARIKAEAQAKVELERQLSAYGIKKAEPPVETPVVSPEVKTPAPAVVPTETLSKPAVVPPKTEPPKPPVLATELPAPPVEKVPVGEEVVKVLEGKKEKDNQTLENLPEPVNGDTAGTKAAGVVAVAEANGIPVESDAGRVVTVESELRGGDNVTEVLTRDLNRTEGKVKHKLNSKKIPKDADPKAVDLYNRWTQTMEGKLREVEGVQADDVAKQKMRDEVIGEHSIVSYHLLEYGGDDATAGLIQKGYQEWLAEKKGPLGTYLTAKRHKAEKQKKRDKEVLEGTKPTKSERTMARQATKIATAWADLQKSAKESEEGKALFDKAVSLAQYKKFREDTIQFSKRIAKFLNSKEIKEKTPEKLHEYMFKEWNKGKEGQAAGNPISWKIGKGYVAEGEPITFNTKQGAEDFLRKQPRPDPDNFNYVPKSRPDGKWYPAKVARTKEVTLVEDAMDYATTLGVDVAGEEARLPLHEDVEFDFYDNPDVEWMYVPVDSDKPSMARFKDQLGEARMLMEQLGLQEGVPLGTLKDPRNEQLRQQTGLFLDPGTGRLTVEISDKGLSYGATAQGRLMAGGTVTLGDLLKHSELYKLVPQLENYSVKPGPYDAKVGGTLNTHEKIITINVPPSIMGDFFWDHVAMTTLLHEMQHGVGVETGFPSGSSPEAWESIRSSLKTMRSAIAWARHAEQKNIPDAGVYQLLQSKPGVNAFADTVIKFRDLPEQGRVEILERLNMIASQSNMELYWNTYGEIMARDTQRRAGMSEEARRMTPPLVDAARTRDGLREIPFSKMLTFVHNPISELLNPMRPQVNYGTMPADVLYHKLLREKGYSEQFASELSKHVASMARVYGELTPLKFGELKEMVNTGKLGMTTKLSDGSRLIAIKILEGDYDPKMMFSVAGHEVSHVMMKLYGEGKLPPEMSQPIDAMMKMMDGLGEVERRDVVKQAYELLMPEKYKAEGAVDALTKNLGNTSELAANLFSIAHTAAVHEGSKTFGERLGMLPMHVMSAVRSALRMFRDVIRSWAGAGAYARHSGYGTLDIKMATDQMRDFTNVLARKVRESNKQENILRDFGNSIKMYPGAMKEYASETDGSSYVEHLPKESRDMIEWMTGDIPELGERKDSFINGWLAPYNLADGDPALKRLAATGIEESTHENRMLRKAEAMLHAVNPDQVDGPLVIDMKNSAVSKVERDPVMQKQLDKIKRLENEQQKTIFQLVVEKQKDAEDLVNALDTNQKALVLESVARMHKVWKAFGEEFYHSTRASKEHVFGEILITRKLVAHDVDQGKMAGKFMYEQAKLAVETGDSTRIRNSLLAMGASEGTMENLTTIFMNQVKILETASKTMRASPWFVSEKRMNRFHVSVRMKANNKTGLYDFKTAQEAKEFIDSVKSDPAVELIDKKPRDVWQNKRAIPPDMEALYKTQENEEAKLRAETKAKLEAEGLPENVIKDIVDSFNFTAGLKEYESSKSFGTLELKQRFKSGREQMNMLEQQMKSIKELSRLFTRRYTDTYVSLMRRDPKVYNENTKAMTDRIEESIRNYRVPDTEMGRILSTIGYVNFVALNPSNMVLEQFGWLTSLAPKLTEEGAGFFGGYKLLLDAIGTTTKLGTGEPIGKDLQKMLYEAELEGRRGLGFLAELNDIFSPPERDASWMTKSLNHLTKMVSKPYQLSVKLNETVALIASFNHAKKKMFPGVKEVQGEQFKQVYAEAVRIASMANNTLGKINRPTALFGNDKQFARTSAQALYSLQSYTASVYANTVRQYRHGFTKAYAELPPAQRQAAKVAFAQALSTFVALAGVAGIPMLMPLDKLQEGITKHSIKDALLAMSKEIDGENSHFFQDFANHGLAHAFGLPFDLSQRIAPTGMFGFNGYDGFSPDRLMGPVYGILTNLYASADSANKGDWTEMYKKALPPVLGNTMALLSNKGKLTDSHSNVLSPASQSWANKLSYVMGFKPAELVRYQDQSELAKKANEATTSSNTSVSNKVATAILSGDVVTARNLLKEVERSSHGMINPLTILESSLGLAEGRMFGADARDLVNLGASQKYDGTGQPPVAPTAGKLQRLKWRAQQRQLMGAPMYTPRKFESAAMIDQIQAQRPTLSTARARAIANSILGPDDGDFLELMSGLPPQ
jgi:hypothetical protein